MTAQPQTLKDFKARFRVGVKLRCDDHWLPRHIGVVRTIVKSQGNGYFFTQTGSFKGDGVTPERYWSPFPKKPELTFNDNGTFTVRPEDGVVRGVFWTLRFEDS